MPKITLMVFNITPNSKGAYILTALSAGRMGAAFGMLLSLKGNLAQTALKDLKVIHKFGYIFSRIIVGMGAALILLYFLHANLIEGVFPPKFTEATPMLDEKNLAILVVWMFLAGFSEKLVPNLLKRTEQRLKDS